jgi:glutamate 5-kinase
MADRKASITEARSVVLKVGTRVLTDDDGVPRPDRLEAIAAIVARLHGEGRTVLLVSSGAIGLGAQALGMARVPREPEVRQASAAVGQSRLMAAWGQALGTRGLLGAQLLLTEADFDARDRYLNLRRALQALLALRVVPVINENDAVSTAELALVLPRGGRPVFGDNDRLSALVASKLGADLLVLLTDVEGVFDADPRSNPGAQLVSTLTPEALRDGTRVQAGDSVSGGGRGGMRSKVEAAAVASRAGCHVIITSGRHPDQLDAALSGEEVGTWVPASRRPPARARWIALAAAPRGTLWLDDGAVTALRERHASLVVAGVTEVEGAFRAGDVVELRAADGQLVARACSAWDAPTVRAWREGTPPSGVRNAHALIRRDQLVMEAP